MFLVPKKPKYSTSFSNINMNTKTYSKNVITNGNFIITSSELGFIANFQIETIRKNLRKLFKKSGKIYIKKLPIIPITKKPNETRLGRGKGAVKYWSNIVKKNDTIIEITTASKKLIQKALKLTKIHLSVKTTIFSRNKRWIF